MPPGHQIVPALNTQFPLGPGKDDRGMFPAIIELRPFRERRELRGRHLDQSGDIGRGSVKFPSDEARDESPFFIPAPSNIQ